MKIAFANAKYSRNDTRGRNAHIGQFITQAARQGHQVWSWPGNEHPDVHLLPAGRLAGLLALRKMDVIYVRLQEAPAAICHSALPPRRRLIGSPLMVWEFNTVPEFGLLVGKTRAQVDQNIADFQRLGQGCDLAVCVSEAIAGYCRQALGIRQTLTVPNGSDPELFHPAAPPVRRVERRPERLNVVWIGSAELAWHNFELMLSAAENLWQSGAGERVAFHIIGGGLKKLSEMPPNIHYHGPDDYHAIPRWLAAMDVGLCLYHPGVADYNSPLKLYDYLASGLAVVATPQPQVCEVISQLGQQPASAGEGPGLAAGDLIVPPADPQALAALLLRLAGDRDRVRRLGQAGRQLVVQHYNWHRAVDDTLGAIQTLAAAR